jgi:hypothetical protein
VTIHVGTRIVLESNGKMPYKRFSFGIFVLSAIQDLSSFVQSGMYGNREGKEFQGNVGPGE